MIPNWARINAAKEARYDFKQNARVTPNSDSLVQLLEFILTKNNFKLHRQHYLQVGTTSMGTKTVPSYSFMGKFKEDFIYTYHIQPLQWKMYIDDCIFIWAGSEGSLSAFLDYLNCCDSKSKFSHEKSQHSVHFLNITVFHEDNTLRTDSYSIPIDIIICSTLPHNKCKHSILIVNTS